MPTLFALITASIGLIRTWIRSYNGRTAWITGKVLGTIMLLGTILAVFGNGAMVYLKSQPEGTIYVELLGPIYFEIMTSLLLVLGFLRGG